MAREIYKEQEDYEEGNYLVLVRRAQRNESRVKWMVVISVILLVATLVSA